VGELEVKPAKLSIETFFGCYKRKMEPVLSINEMDQAIPKAVEIS